MSKHGVDVLKQRLRNKISDLQSDAEAIKGRLEDEKRIQANLKRCQEKLSAKLDASFTRLYEILERYKQEFNGKVNSLFSHHRRAVAKENKALDECLASVNKACADAEEVLKENGKSAFLAAHNKVSHQLEECFVELLMLDEPEACSVSFAGVESLEKKLDLFSFEDNVETDKNDVKDYKSDDQELTTSISSPLTVTTPVVVPNAIQSSVHPPFVFNSLPSSTPASSSNCSFLVPPVSVKSSSFISFSIVTPSTNTGMVSSAMLVSASTSTVPSSQNVSSLSMLVSNTATITSSSVVSSPSVSSVTLNTPNTVGVLQSTASSVVRVSTSSVSSIKDSSSKSTSKSTGTTTVTKKSVPLTTSSSAHSSKVTIAKDSTTNSVTSKKPKPVTTKTVTMSTTSKSSSLPVISKHCRTSSHVKLSCLSDLKQGDEMECVVTEVTSPSEFWIQPINYDLITLMKNMEFYYTQLERRGDCGGLDKLPKVGDYCCARYSHDCKWYRARILSVNVKKCDNGLSCHQISVLYVDYGNQEEVSLSSLRPLEYKFVHLPCQAIKCSLKIKPFVEISSPELKGSGIPQWPKHTKKWFKSLLVGKHAGVKFLTANSSNHAQVDITINREMFLPSLSCLRGVLSITEGIKQFLQSTHFNTSFGVSSFMCLVKLAVFSGDKWLENHLFCTPSVFTFPALGPPFMHPYTTGVPFQNSLFPVVKYYNSSPLPIAFSPPLVQHVVSPTSTLQLPDEPHSHSEMPMTTQKPISKKRTASLLGDGDSILPNSPVDLPQKSKKQAASHVGDHNSSLPSCCGSNSQLQEQTSPKYSDRSTGDGLVMPIAMNNFSVVDVITCTASRTECSGTLSASASSHSSKSSTPSSHPSSGLCMSNPLAPAIVAQSVSSVSPSPLSENDSTRISSLPAHNSAPCETENSPQASPPLFTIVKSPECNKNTPKGITNKSDCIKFHTIAALPILSSVISSDSGHYSVIVSHVVSPSEFYLNFASDADEVKNFDSFQELLHDYYSTEKEDDDNLSANLTVGVICSAKYKDGTWNRGIIRDIKPALSEDGDEKKRKYLIQYVDYGNYHWVAIDDIRSLQEDFLSQPALTICCSLSVLPHCVKKWRPKKASLSSEVLIAPAGSEDDLEDNSEELFIHNDHAAFESAEESKDTPSGGAQDWSQEATDRFINLTNNKVLVAVLNEEMMMLSWDDVLEVELIDTNGATDLIIADDLVTRGLAKHKMSKSATKKDRDTEISYQDRVGLCDTDQSDSRSSTVKSDKSSFPATKTTGVNLLGSLTETAAMDTWNPMESHFLSNWNLYQESAVNNGGRGSLIFRERRDKQDEGLRDPAMVSKSWKAQTISLPAKNACIPIVVTAVYSPVKFWAQLLPTEDTLSSDDEGENRNVYEVTFTQLCEEMNKQYSRSVFKEREPELIAHGELVAAMSPEDSCWYRAVLKDFDDNTNSVLVAFVDYGDNAWISEANVRRLHPKFAHLPIQAVECMLDGLKVNEEVDMNWAIQEFLEIVKDKAFAAHVIERDTVLNRLSLELYDTSGITGATINVKHMLLSRKIAIRASTVLCGTSTAPGWQKKNTSNSLPG